MVLRVALTISISSRLDGLGTKVKASATADRKRDLPVLRHLRDDAVQNFNLFLGER
jgi:hypothetical protein